MATMTNTQAISNYENHYQIAQAKNLELMAVKNEILSKHSDKSIIECLDAAFDIIHLDNNGVIINENKMAKDLSQESLFKCLTVNLEMLISMVQYRNLFGTDDAEIAKNKKEFLLLLVENILKEHRSIRVLEIREVFRRGGNKKYLENNFFTISPSEINRWFLWYKTEQGHALKLYYKYLQSQKDTKESNEMLKLSQGTNYREYCQRIYEHRMLCNDEYISMGFYNCWAAMMYDFLDKSKIISIDNDRKLKELDTQIITMYSHFVSVKTMGGSIGSSQSEFMKMVKDNPDLRPLQRVNKLNEYYTGSIVNTKKAIFRQELLSKSIAEWQKILNEFLNKNNYQPL